MDFDQSLSNQKNGKYNPKNTDRWDDPLMDYGKVWKQQQQNQERRNKIQETKYQTEYT